MATENQSFIEILEKNQDMVLRICNAYASEVLEKEDLFQEVAVAIWKSLPNFQGHSGISTWIYRIALNTCIGLTIRARKKTIDTIKLQSIHLQEMEDHHNSAEQEKAFLQLRNCIQQLPEPDKSIVLLHLEELPYKEISRVIGINENHVAVKIKRAKQKLLTCINLLNHG